MEGSIKGSGKSVEAGAPLRTLTLFDGISTIVSLMVGSGIFSTAGNIQQGVGSPGFSLIMWGVTGLLGLAGALCYAELGTMIPGSGGEAQYLARGLGPLMVFLFNWTSIMILKPGTVAILSVATADYLMRMIFVFAGNDTHGGFSEAGYAWLCKGVAMIVCVIVTLGASLSTRWSNRIQSVLTFGKIGALTLVIGSGFYYAVFHDSTIIKENLGSPFEGSFFKFGSMAEALTGGLWAYEGWNNLNIVAGDLANPKVNLPLSIWISMVAVVSLYLLTLVGYYSVLPKAIVGATKTIGVDFGLKVFGKAGNAIMPLLIASSTFGSALSSMVTSSEIVVLAAQNGQIPSYFKKISPTLGTAARAYWLQCILACVLVLLSGFDTLLMVYAFPQWIFYGSCVIVLLKLRYTDPTLERPYRVWFSTPILFLLACVWLIASTFVAEWFPVSLSLGVILLGIPMYHLFSYLMGRQARSGGMEKIPMAETADE